MNKKPVIVSNGSIYEGDPSTRPAINTNLPRVRLKRDINIAIYHHSGPEWDDSIYPRGLEGYLLYQGTNRCTLQFDVGDTLHGVPIKAVKFL